MEEARAAEERRGGNILNYFVVLVGETNCMLKGSRRDCSLVYVGTGTSNTGVREETAFSLNKWLKVT